MTAEWRPLKRQKKMWDLDWDRNAHWDLGRGWTHIGSGTVTQGEARDLLTRNRLCGRQLVGNAYERGERCSKEANRFSPACNYHMSSAERDAYAIAEMAFELGRTVGWQGLIMPEDPGFRREFHPSVGARRALRSVAIKYRHSEDSPDE